MNTTNTPTQGYGTIHPKRALARFSGEEERRHVGGSIGKTSPSFTFANTTNGLLTFKIGDPTDGIPASQFGAESFSEPVLTNLAYKAWLKGLFGNATYTYQAATDRREPR